MFGTIRLLLAGLVILSHLPGDDKLIHFGFYAVRGFFVLSGFLITAGLHKVYEFDTKRFWLSRLLRLLPPYYLVCLLTLLVIAQFPEEAAAYLPSWKSDMPQLEALGNLLVLPLQFPEQQFRLVPPYWSVAIELQMYALLFVAAARSETLAIATLWLGVVYHLACVQSDLGFGARYFAAPSATLAFGAGALAYFWVERGALVVGPGAAALALGLWISYMAGAGSILPDDFAFGTGYYIATFLFAIVVAGVAKMEWSPVLKRIDRAFGEIAYPVFLVQWLAGFITALAIGTGVWRGWELTVASIPLILGMAIVMAMLNRRLVEPARAKYRGPATTAPGCLQPAAIPIGRADTAQV